MSLFKPKPQHERVLVIGQNYHGTSYQLEGCLEDASGYFNYFTSRLVSSDRQTILWRDEPTLITSVGMHRALDWVLSSATLQQLLDPNIMSFKQWPIQPNTNIYFACAGHGTAIHGRVDTLDQSLVASNGYVTDDQINDLLYQRMQSTTQFMGCVDCCSSGTIADLKWILRNNSVTADKNHNITRVIPGLVQFFSACQDDGTAAEINTGGLFTQTFLKYSKVPHLPLNYLLDRINQDLQVWGQTADITSNKSPRHQTCLI